MSDVDLCDRLRRALQAARSPWADAALQPMADKGLAHHHVRLLGHGAIARLPKQSQMGLDAQAALDYQAACFERAGATGAAPQLIGRLPPSDALPRGGLLVQEIVGRSARLPQDLPAIARALAAIHALPLPAPAHRAPLRHDADPLQALRDEIDAQANHLDGAGLDARTRAHIDAQRAALQRRCAAAARPQRRLIAFDAHPGNFVVRDEGSAVLVDLEKARYGYCALDLAHATLYTSTTWDVDAHAELTLEEIASTYDAWAAHSDAAVIERAWWLPLRAAMWLWSVTWCAKWRALSARSARTDARGEDWSHHLSDAALVAHVRDRVDCYLSAAVIELIVDEFAALQRRWR
jgi:thiamine kinase-like enzyme